MRHNYKKKIIEQIVIYIIYVLQKKKKEYNFSNEISCLTRQFGDQNFVTKKKITLPRISALTCQASITFGHLSRFCAKSFSVFLHLKKFRFISVSSIINRSISIKLKSARCPIEKSILEKQTKIFDGGGLFSIFYDIQVSKFNFLYFL